MPAVLRKDENPNPCPRVNKINLINVDRADGCLHLVFVPQFNHQPDLSLRIDILIVQYELFYFEKRNRRPAFCHLPECRIVFPNIQKVSVFRLERPEGDISGGEKHDVLVAAKLAFNP